MTKNNNGQAIEPIISNMAYHQWLAASSLLAMVELVEEMSKNKWNRSITYSLGREMEENK